MFTLKDAANRVSVLVGAQNVQTATNVSTVGSGLFKDGSTMLSLSIIPSPIFPTIANSSVMNDTGSCLGEVSSKVSCNI